MSEFSPSACHPFLRLAIFGSSGFIGRHLALHARRLGHKVYCLDRDLTTRGADCFCDLSKGEEIRLPFKVDAAFYLAQSPYYRQFPEYAENLFAVNALGPVIAAKAVQDAGGTFFCYASSGNVYAPSFSPLSEHDATSAASPYAASKLMGEMGTACFKNSMRVINCRIFGAYGPGQHAMLPWVLLQRICRNQAVELSPGPGNGGLRISFIFVDDLVKRLLGLLELKENASLPEVLNLAGPEPVSVREFADAMARAMGRPVVFTASARLREFDLWADIALLNSLCPYPFTPLDKGVEETARAFQEARK